jgi:hypothetical protein
LTHNVVVAGELTPVAVGEIVKPTAFTPANCPQRFAVMLAPLTDRMTVTWFVMGNV